MMRILASSTLEEISAAIARLAPLPAYTIVRAPQVGLVMARGRVGGDGAAFNLGEMTVTRAAVQVEGGELGIAWQLGRSHDKAMASALIDAIWQTAQGRERVDALVLEPLLAAQSRRYALADARTAATKVDFFTLVRGEDE